MRFALIATSVTAVVASPFIADATGPQMTSDQFLNAVRCAAYEQVVDPSASLGAVKAHLNAEARRQPAETARRARAEVNAITAVSVETTEEAAMMHREQASACAGASLVAGAGSQRAA